MRFRPISIFLTVLLLCLSAVTASAQVTSYSQDFEGMSLGDAAALTADGWLVFGNVYLPDGVTYLYGYGPFPAPNHPWGFSAIDTLQGGPDQGALQLNVFNDYNNTDHAVGNRIEANVYREWTIDASNVGQRWGFDFNAKMGNLELASTANAFIKTLDPLNGYATTNLVTVDMTTIPTTWDGYLIYLDIDASLVGQLFQIGFACTASNYEGSGIYYDNILLNPISSTPAPASLRAPELSQNYPNPFNPSTHIEFYVPRAGSVDITVYDLAGRRVANLFQGDLPEGDHGVNWDGKTDAGVPVASGHYRYVLRTSAGEVARGMTLLK